MYLAGSILLKGKNIETIIDIIVADVFDENESLKVAIAGTVDPMSDDLSEDLNNYDSIVCTSMTMNYCFYIVSKSFDLNCDMVTGVDNEIVRLHLDIQNDKTIITNADLVELAESEPIPREEVEELTNTLKQSKLQYLID